MTINTGFGVGPDKNPKPNGKSNGYMNRICKDSLLEPTASRNDSSKMPK
jgi:hypothetical protein